MSADQSCVAEMRKMYQGRRDVVMEGLKKLGLEAATPKATFYVWGKMPRWPHVE